MAGVILTTERLILRPFRPEEAGLYAAINSDPDTMRYLGGPRSRAMSDAEVSGANECLAASGYGKVAIERRSDGAFMGMCGLSREGWFPDDLEIGWRLAPAARGHGYATEAAQAWIEYGFATLALPRIISIADVPNQRSIAVMQRLGLTFDHQAMLDDDGEMFEAVIYAITADQFTANRSSKA
ncbi:MAG: GNAT family N-acetyltransferase [Devosia sp.]